MARLADVVSDPLELPRAQRPWFFGPYGFVLADVRELPFMPCKGQLGFFAAPPEIEARVRSIIG